MNHKNNINILLLRIVLLFAVFAQGMPCYAHLSYATTETYFTHNDHLGSASWITEIHGYPIQYLHYLPYGQLLANQMLYGYDERFKFICKERDWESGYDYFGARYYISPFIHFASVEPLLDKYLHISPYCNYKK